MNTTSFISSSLIFLGICVVFFSTIKTRELLGSLYLFQINYMQANSRYLVFHRKVMIFFLYGYLVVLIYNIFKFAVNNEFFVSLIFLFGAMFVYFSMMNQAGFMSKMEVNIVTRKRV